MPGADPYIAGWSRGVRLYQHLSDGRDLFAALPPAPVTADDGAPCYAPTVFEYARFYGLDPTLTRGRWRRPLAREAGRLDAQAEPRWRDERYAPTVLSSERLLCQVDGEWCSFWFAGTTHIGVDLPGWSLAFGFDDGVPLQLCGPDVPWYTVAIGYLTNGPNALALPELAALAESAPAPPHRA